MMTGTTEKYNLPIANPSDTFDASDINTVTEAVEEAISEVETAHVSDIERLDEELNTAKEATGEVSAEVDKNTAKITEVTETMESNISDLEERLATLNEQIEHAKLDLETLQTAMQTKAGLNTFNVFTEQQKILFNNEPGLIIHREDDSLPGLSMSNNNGALHLIGDLTSDTLNLYTRNNQYKLLDSRDISQYNVANLAGIGVKGAEVNINRLNIHNVIIGLEYTTINEVQYIGSDKALITFTYVPINNIDANMPFTALRINGHVIIYNIIERNVNRGFTFTIITSNGALSIRSMTPIEANTDIVIQMLLKSV